MIDGINVQDALLRSSDGFFADIQPKSDNIEEMTLSTAGSARRAPDKRGASALRHQVRQQPMARRRKLVGTQRLLQLELLFQHDRQLPRDRIDLNQVGARLGGPIWKNKAFFFISDEEFRLPQTYKSATQTVLTSDASNGIFAYKDSVTGAIVKRNLYDLRRPRIRRCLPERAPMRQRPIRLFPTS